MALTCSYLSVSMLNKKEKPVEKEKTRGALTALREKKPNRILLLNYFCAVLTTFHRLMHKLITMNKANVN